VRLEPKAEHVQARVRRKQAQQREQRARRAGRRRRAQHQVQHAVGVQVEGAHQLLDLARLRARRAPASGAARSWGLLRGAACSRSSGAGSARRARGRARRAMGGVAALRAHGGRARAPRSHGRPSFGPAGRAASPGGAGAGARQRAGLRVGQRVRAKAVERGDELGIALALLAQQVEPARRRALSLRLG